jgi:hypothetical protein
MELKSSKESNHIGPVFRANKCKNEKLRTLLHTELPNKVTCAKKSE